MKKNNLLKVVFLVIFSLFILNAYIPNINAETTQEEVTEQTYKYTITYVLNGGNNSTLNPSGYDGNVTIKFKNPTKTGYTFGGWYSDSKFKKKVTSFKSGTKGNKTLYAKWTVNKYTVKFNANGGSGKMSNKTMSYNKTYTLTTNAFKRTGYKFVEWNTKKDGSGTSYTNKDKVKNLTSKNKGTITLYAIWKKNTYTIKYNLNGGKEVSNPTTYTVTTSTITLKNSSKTGYTFSGWYSDSKFKKKVTSIKKGSAGNKTLYAKWTVNKYTVKFNANGGSGKMSNKTMSYNKTYTLTTNAFKKTGYKFVEWNSKADGSGTSYTNKDKVKNLTSKNKGTITLYAIWEKVTYKITYKLDGGTNNTNNPSTYTVTTSTITLKSPTKDGYIFKGWYSDSKYKTKVTSIKKGSTGSKTLYAKWQKDTAKKYTITYYLEGGTNNPNNVTTYTKNSDTITLYNPTREHYKFLGWYVCGDYDCDQKITSIKKGSTGDKKLLAKWEQSEYRIRYNIEFDVPNDNPQYYDGTKNIVLKDLYKEDYTFDGWYTEYEYTNTGKVYKNKITEIPAGTPKDLTLYAKFTPINYTITYHLDEGINNENNRTTYNASDAWIFLNNPTKRGYVFEGWYFDKDFQNKITSSFNALKENKRNMDLYAKWSRGLINNIGDSLTTNEYEYALDIDINPNYFVDIRCKSNDETIAICPQDSYNDGKTYFKLRTFKPGETDIVITERFCENDYYCEDDQLVDTIETTIHLTVSNFWKDVKIEKPDLIPLSFSSGYANNDFKRYNGDIITIEEYGFDHVSFDKYSMYIKIKVKSLNEGQGNSYNDVSLYYFGKDNRIISSSSGIYRAYLSLYDANVGDEKQIVFNVPRFTDRIVFLDKPDTVETTGEYNYNNLTYLNAYLYEAKYNLKMVNPKEASNSSSLQYDIDWDFARVVEYLDYAKTIIENRDSIELEDGKTMLSEIQKIEKFYEEEKTYEFDDSTWYDYRDKVYNHVVESTEILDNLYEKAVELLNNTTKSN